MTTIKPLSGYRRITLGPGETTTVRFKLNPEHFTMLDAEMQARRVSGDHHVLIGSSSVDGLRGKVNSVI